MSLVHKTVVNVRLAFTDDDSSLLPGIRDGEARILSSYDEALRDTKSSASTTAPHADVLARQRNAVLENIARIDSMEAAA